MMTSLSVADDTSITPSGIDHILYAASDLERGMDEIEAILGMRPVRGGHHPQYGTHNALLSLGPGIYLEIIGRAPDLPVPERGALVDIAKDDTSRLITWVFRTGDITGLAAAAHEATLGIGPVESGSRKNPDGSEISWELTDPYAMPMDGAVPFLINWGDTTHPSGIVPSGGRLVELVIKHPDAERVRRAMSVLGAEIRVVDGDGFLISAKIESKKGLITLR